MDVHTRGLLVLSGASLVFVLTLVIAALGMHFNTQEQRCLERGGFYFKAKGATICLKKEVVIPVEE